MIAIEVENRSGEVVDAAGAESLARDVLTAEGIAAGDLGIAFVRFNHNDVVRHKLVQRIVEAYKQHAEETGTARNR